MEYFLIPITTLLASILTFFSGFGLGTILLPVFVIFFPAHISIALTAIVHLLNNLFKLIIMGKYGERLIIVKFGLPALIFCTDAYILFQLKVNCLFHCNVHFLNKDYLILSDLFF